MAYKKVISYVIFHSSSIEGIRHNRQLEYLVGLVHNVRIKPFLFPEYEIWVHYDSSIIDKWNVAYNLLKWLEKDKLIHLIPIPKDQEWLSKNPTCARYLPIWDSTVKIVLCRDVDSILSITDKKCVETWLRNKKSKRNALIYKEYLMKGLISCGGGFSYSSTPTEKPIIDDTSNLWGKRGYDEQFITDNIKTLIPNDSKIRATTYSVRADEKLNYYLVNTDNKKVNILWACTFWNENYGETPDKLRKLTDDQILTHCKQLNIKPSFLNLNKIKKEDNWWLR